MQARPPPMENLPTRHTKRPPLQAYASTNATTIKPGFEASSLPPGWRLEWSKGQRRNYYYHAQTGASQWEAPQLATQCRNKRPRSEPNPEHQQLDDQALSVHRGTKDPKISRVGLDDTNQAPANAVMKYSARELSGRRQHKGSTLSLIDQRKFEREVDVRSLNLSSEARRAWQYNPHLRCVFANRQQMQYVDRWMQDTDRIVSADSGRTQYKRRIGEAKTVVHWGQLKLLLSEIEFLTAHSRADDVVVYAGAAPGTHTEFLASLFPRLSFVLVDPADFHCQPTDRITVMQQLFTDELADSFVPIRDRLLFVSDIRAIDKQMSSRAVEEQVQRDMKIQQEWVQKMRPRVSMLKFRLPYEAGQTQYLDGKVYFQMFAGATSSETRLVVKAPESESEQCATVTYDHGDYEDVMFHFNTVTRVSHWRNSCTRCSAAVVDRCYDCSAMVHVLRQYVMSRGGDPFSTDEEVEVMIGQIHDRFNSRHSSTPARHR